MSGSIHLVVFALGQQRFALPLGAVDRVIRAVEITQLPKAPELVLGVINLHGQIIPVINLRKRCRLSDREIALDDQFIIAHTSRRSVALVVDRADVLECAAERIVPSEKIMPGFDDVKEVFKRDDGLVLIYELEMLLTPEDEHLLGGAIDATLASADGGAS